VVAHAGLGHLRARLHAVLRRDGQGAFSGRHDLRQGHGALQTAALGSAAIEPAADGRIRRYDGRHDGQRRSAADSIGRAVKERLQPWLPGGSSADAITTTVSHAAKNQSPIVPPPPASIVTPPPIARRASPCGQARCLRSGVYRPRMEKTPLPDTKIDFPELPQVSDSSESSASPPVFFLELGEDEDSSSLEMQIPEADPWSRHLRPALLLLLIPLTLIAGALFVWGLSKLL